MSKIIAVDFDGTLCNNLYPLIGAPITSVLDYVKDARKGGAKVILWTCRTGILLNEAVEWCHEHGLDFDAVNENLPEIIEAFGGDTRKIYADTYIDDKCYPVDSIKTIYVEGTKRQRLTRLNKKQM